MVRVLGQALANVPTGVLLPLRSHLAVVNGAVVTEPAIPDEGSHPVGRSRGTARARERGESDTAASPRSSVEIGSGPGAIRTACRWLSANRPRNDRGGLQRPPCPGEILRPDSPRRPEADRQFREYCVAQPRRPRVSNARGVRELRLGGGQGVREGRLCDEVPRRQSCCHGLEDWGGKAARRERAADGSLWDVGIFEVPRSAEPSNARTRVPQDRRFAPGQAQ